MNSFLVRHWFLIFITLAVGFTLWMPDVVKPATEFWEPRLTMGVSLFLVAFTMPTRSLVDEIRRPTASLWAVLLSYGLVPASAYLLGLLAPNDSLRIGLILISTVPCTLSSAILWTRMAGGNEATALLTVLGTTFSSWILTTAWLYLLTGKSTNFDVIALMVDLIVGLILPVGVGQALRRIPPCKRFAERFKVPISALSQLCVLAIILRAGVGVGEELHRRGTGAAAVFAWGIGLAITLHLFALFSGLVSCRWLGFDRGRQIAVGFSASQKTLQVSLILYEQYYRVDYPYAVIPLLFYHVGQLLLDTVIAKQIAKHASPADEPGPLE